MDKGHLLEIPELFQALQTSGSGLSTAEVLNRRSEHGLNELRNAKQRSKLGILLSQFKDVMILILIIAAIVSFIADEQTDAFVILCIVLVNAIIGFVQENHADESIKKLQQVAAQNALVVRGDQYQHIPASELVPGDVIVLEAGNIVPADARLFEVQSLKAEEAALTGESHSVEKHTRAIEGKNLQAADKANMVFKGTMISNGGGKAVITGTGMNTEMGKIAGMLDTEEQQTPLQKKMAKFSKQLTLVVLVLCLIIFGFGMSRGAPVLTMFLTALSLAVAALPEALPAIITISLARGASRMMDQNALMRRLSAVETLGSVNYICSDKTGTLTQNVMTVVQTRAAEGREQMLLQSMLLNSEVKKDHTGKMIGDSTEIALSDYAVSKGMDRLSLEKEMPRIGEIPFDSDRMLMSTLHRKGNTWVLLVKGAPVKIAERLALSAEEKEHWLQENRAWAAEGLRVLFFASKEFDAQPDPLDTSLEVDLEFIGMTGMIDPPRKEAIEAIRECHDAGITTVMITGDQPLTAKAIATELNILNDPSHKVISGAELMEMSDDDLSKEVSSIRVYARVSPEQKLRIIKALQQNEAFVSMTGDGVNDAPSLKQADIGVAMGITGTDVSKEAAHMILLDDNFATIVKAVREGRRIYDNIRKFVQYILACNLGELLTIFIAPFLGFPVPLLATHILWINLVTDGLPGVALANERAESDIMKRPPRDHHAGIFDRHMLWSVCATGIILAAGGLITQYWAISHHYNVAVQQTLVFTFLCFAQLLNALSVRTGKRWVLHRFISNPFLLLTISATVFLQFVIIYHPYANKLLKTSAPDLKAILFVAGLSFASLLLMEISKYFYNSWSNQGKRDPKVHVRD